MTAAGEHGTAAACHSTAEPPDENAFEVGPGRPNAAASSRFRISLRKISNLALMGRAQGSPPLNSGIPYFLGLSHASLT